MKVGIVGTIIAAICCFTPVLVISFTTIGLSAWLVGLDYILLPALTLFVGLAVFAIFRNSRAPGDR